MKTLNLIIVMMTGTLVFFIAAYILDISMRSSYSNANLLARFDIPTKALVWSDYACSHLIPGCSDEKNSSQSASALKSITF